MVTRREAAQRLDISLEMAHRHGIPPRLSEDDLLAIESDPPVWLAQSRANRTGKKPVWVTLTCTVCGYAEEVRPKKWWPDFSCITCADHDIGELPDAEPGTYRREYDGIGLQFVGVHDEVVITS